jgi:hypothetical protein
VSSVGWKYLKRADNSVEERDESVALSYNTGAADEHLMAVCERCKFLKAGGMQIDVCHSRAG